GNFLALPERVLDRPVCKGRQVITALQDEAVHLYYDSVDLGSFHALAPRVSLASGCQGCSLDPNFTAFRRCACLGFLMTVFSHKPGCMCVSVLWPGCCRTGEKRPSRSWRP